MTDTRRPPHLGVMLGLSTGAYALSLAVVTAFQARTDAAVLNDRAPTADAIARLGAGNDALETRAAAAADAYRHATGAYERVTSTVADVEARLAELAAAVQAVDGAASALPNRVALPRVTRTVNAAAPVVVHATTAASGG